MLRPAFDRVKIVDNYDVHTLHHVGKIRQWANPLAEVVITYEIDSDLWLV